MPSKTPPKILKQMASTYKERNKVYKDNFRKTGAIMEILYPDGIPGNAKEEYVVFDLFHMLLGKITRFANSDHTHEDSIHDVAVYAAMIEAELARDSDANRAD